MKVTYSGHFTNMFRTILWFYQMSFWCTTVQENLNCLSRHCLVSFCKILMKDVRLFASDMSVLTVPFVSWKQSSSLCPSFVFVHLLFWILWFVQIPGWSAEIIIFNVKGHTYLEYKKMYSLYIDNLVLVLSGN